MRGSRLNVFPAIIVPGSVAVIVVTPVPALDARPSLPPALLIVATPVADELHVTLVVMKQLPLPRLTAGNPYFDAIVPEDGESVLGLFGEAIDSMAEAGGGGAEPWQLVPRWVDKGEPPPVDVPQPLLTFTEPIELTNPVAAEIPAVFLLTREAGKETDTFDPFADRARARGWEVVEMEGSHNPHWFQPRTFVEVLLGIVRQ